jgi:hypothetical protein
MSRGKHVKVLPIAAAFVLLQTLAFSGWRWSAKETLPVPGGDFQKVIVQGNAPASAARWVSSSSYQAFIGEMGTLPVYFR